LSPRSRSRATLTVQGIRYFLPQIDVSLGLGLIGHAHRDLSDEHLFATFVFRRHSPLIVFPFHITSSESRLDVQI
jgi:hypothetical protein